MQEDGAVIKDRAHALEVGQSARVLECPLLRMPSNDHRSPGDRVCNANRGYGGPVHGAAPYRNGYSSRLVRGICRRTPMFGFSAPGPWHPIQVGTLGLSPLSSMATTRR